MKFLNGFKSIIGGVGLLVVALNEQSHLLPETWRPYVAGASALLLALGLVHKAEKKIEAKKDAQFHEEIMQRLRDEAERNGEA